MKTTFINCCILMAAACFAAGCNDRSADSTDKAEEANDQKFGKPMEKDADFVVKAANGGMMEVELGKLAQAKAVSQQTKEFATAMVNDHSKANDELKAMASQKNISMPASMSNDMQEKYNDLDKKSGMDFDKAYISYMVKDHKEDIDLFRKQADNGSDTELKNWAGQTLPTLEHHLQMAKQADSILSKK